MTTAALQCTTVPAWFQNARSSNTEALGGQAKQWPTYHPQHGLSQHWWSCSCSTPRVWSDRKWPFHHSCHSLHSCGTYQLRTSHLHRSCPSSCCHKYCHRSPHISIVKFHRISSIHNRPHCKPACQGPTLTFRLPRIRGTKAGLRRGGEVGTKERYSPTLGLSQGLGSKGLPCSSRVRVCRLHITVGCSCSR